jgi:malonate transporter MadM subunit
MEIFENFIDKNGLIVGFLVIGVLAFLSEVFSKKILKGYLPGSAIAILAGLILAYFGGVITNGEKGLSDLPFLKGLGVFGGSMFRDFTIVATAMGASYLTMKKAGWLGLVSLLFGIVFFFVFGVALAYVWGIRDAASLCTIGAGSCTYIVGPVTGAALGASSEVIALSIATFGQKGRLKQSRSGHGFWWFDGHQLRRFGRIGGYRPRFGALRSSYGHFLHRLGLFALSFFILFGLRFFSLTNQSFTLQNRPNSHCRGILLARHSGLK